MPNYLGIPRVWHYVRIPLILINELARRWPKKGQNIYSKLLYFYKNTAVLRERLTALNVNTDYESTTWCHPSKMAILFPTHNYKQNLLAYGTNQNIQYNPSAAPITSILKPQTDSAK
jgi:hypothetical protein